MESAMVAIMLTLLGLPRMWNDLNPNNPMMYAFVGGLALALFAFIVMHIWLDRNSQKR